jgi:hypothetical protein
LEPKTGKRGKSKTRNPISLVWNIALFFFDRFEFVSNFEFRYSDFSPVSLILALWEREWVRVERQREDKPAALPDFALYPDLTSVQFDKLLGQG